MTMQIPAEGPFYRADGSFLGYVDVAATLKLDLVSTQEEGPPLPQDLTGRVFLQRILDGEGATLLEIHGVNAVDGLAHRVAFPLTQADTRTLLPTSGAAARDLTHVVGEVTIGGFDQAYSASFSLRRLRRGMPATVMQMEPNVGVVLVRYAGAPPLSLLEELIASGDLGEDATHDDLVDWLQDPANDAAQAALTAIAGAASAVVGIGGSIDDREDQALAAIAGREDQAVDPGGAIDLREDEALDAIAEREQDAIRTGGAIDVREDAALDAVDEKVDAALADGGELDLAIQAAIDEASEEGGPIGDAVALVLTAIANAGVVILDPVTGTLTVAAQAALDAIATAGDAILDPTTGALPLAVEAALDALALAQTAAMIQFETWATLSGISGTTVGQGAKVFGPDAGTHTDPVVGGTVANKGVYRWSAAPAGWKWLVGLEADAAAASAAAAAAAALTATAMLGYSTPSATDVPLIAIQGKRGVGLNAEPTHGDFGEITWRGGPLRGAPRRQRGRRLLATAIPKADRYHILGYGQSGGLGLDSSPILSATPSTRHKTFNVGVRATKPGITGGTLAHDGAEKFLVETETSTPAGLGGETKHSTAVREAWRLCKDAGIGSPMFFCSEAGKGSTKLASLKNGTAWYENLRYQWQAAKALATTAGHSYALPFIAWDHCEFDQQDNTSKASYKADMIAMITAVAADVLTDTGYAGPIYWLCSLNDHQIRTSRNAADALIELAAERNDVCIYMPLHIAPAINTYHRSNTGQMLKGAYLGRAIADMLAGYRPECWTWGQARASGTTVYVSFDTPTPGQFDTTVYPKVTDYGIKIQDDTGTLTLSNIQIVGGYVLQVTVHRALGANPVFRNGLDYWASSIPTATAAGSNLADMSARDVTLAGDTFALVHAAPPCSLPIEVTE